MSDNKTYDVAIIGGGIVGMATALALSERPGLSMVVLEAESKLANHQTGNNSGVIHSGLYYKPGSLKATHCAAGREDMYSFAEEHGVAAARSWWPPTRRRSRSWMSSSVEVAPTASTGSSASGPSRSPSGSPT